MNDIIFSLDIGTRKIAAVVARENGGRLEIIASRLEEHRERRVKAGLIHDIDNVAADVARLKGTLEKECGVTLNKVATAIAGRGMKSYRAQGLLGLGSFKEISSDDLRNAELAAIQEILNSKSDEMDEYYFIGHTPVRWEIDGEAFTKPLGHSGTAIKVEIIAAFLPRKVLESLFAVLKRANLELSYLTLEPIAATEGVLSDDMKHIPMVLVDIGAGTSDIAVIQKGAIQSFAMLPQAGDSITEYICSEYLVDFAEAERIKKRLSGRKIEKSDTAESEVIKFKDIFDRDYEKSAGEVLEKIRPATSELAQKIADEIKLITQTCPDVTSEPANQQTYSPLTQQSSPKGLQKACAAHRSGALGEHLTATEHLESSSGCSETCQVLGDVTLQRGDTGGCCLPLSPNYGIVLVGGGALTPSLADEISKASGLDARRIGVRHPSMSNKFLGITDEISGPHAAVALGAAALALKYPTTAIMHVAINEEKKELVNFSGAEQTILSALVLSGISKQKILGRPGLALSFNVNGEFRALKGALPRPAKLLLNDKEASLDSKIKDGDRVTFAPARDGLNASGKVKDILSEDEVFYFNGEKIPFPADIKINGATADEESEITDRCEITFEYKRALKDALLRRGVDVKNFLKNEIGVDVNGTTLRRATKNWRLKINETVMEELDENLPLKTGDAVELEQLKTSFKAGDFIPAPPAGKNLRILINGEEFMFPGARGKILVNGKEADADTNISDGDIVRTAPGKDAEAILVDIFKYISLEPTDNVGKKIKLLVNSEEAAFTTPLFDGAEVKVGWEG